MRSRRRTGNDVEQPRELVAVTGARAPREGREGRPDLLHHPFRELAALRGDEHLDDPTVLGRPAPRHETPTLGTFAERAVINPRHSVVPPSDIDPVRIAAAMNPAMSSRVALRRRIAFREGRSVLVLGATGNAGRMAVQIAKRFGASHVIAVGRDASRLAALRGPGADETVTFDRADRAADVDVVIDYVWGEPSALAMTAIVTARRDPGAPLDWIRIGSVAGRAIPVHSALLRSARLQLCGSGIGSVPPRDFLAELPELAAVHTGAIDVRARAVPLTGVTETWGAETEDRIVYIP
ncbi:zinc-binding alcohol dehydrogenase family protein [Streptomyces calidiresistens]|uniref:Zinc-binding alcohol dehydrogenase family protein n=1 Tax=Streptomyces calidiresistens TaxID=1485586 RepID=A0A7W3T826_9ACTN|nr:zinc-binding alcohol dehydrogenase family protein [Streptomyces calidiresistens]MBB0232391.1 zinc-binding alcohol dehydrogenase family protein [Streptomyces calidiresistens]